MRMYYMIDTNKRNTTNTFKSWGTPSHVFKSMKMPCNDFCFNIWYEICIDYFWFCLLDGSGNAFELSKQELLTSKSTHKPKVWLFSVQFGNFTSLSANNYKLSKQVQSCRQFKNEKKGRKIIWGLIEVLWSSGGQWRPLEARIKETSVCWKMIQQKWVEILVHTWLWKPW